MKKGRWNWLNALFWIKTLFSFLSNAWDWFLLLILALSTVLIAIALTPGFSNVLLVLVSSVRLIPKSY